MSFTFPDSEIEIRFTRAFNVDATVTSGKVISRGKISGELSETSCTTTRRRYEKQFTVLSRRRARTRANARGDLAPPFRVLDSPIDELCDLIFI